MRLLLSAALILVNSILLAQCPTSGTISSNCTTIGNMTITGGALTINPGVTVTVTGTLKIEAGATLTATGANINAGNLEEAYGGHNRINGGTFGILGRFSAGGGGDFTMSGSTINMNPGGTVSIAGGALTINNSTFTGVTSWTTNVSSLSMNGTNISSSGSIQLRSANVTSCTLNVGTSLTIDNGTSAVSGSTFNVGTTASLRNTSFSNSTFQTGGRTTIQSGAVSFTNSDIDIGTGNSASSGVTALDFNGGGVLSLFGDTQMDVKGDVINNEWYVDDSDVRITGNFDNAGSEILEVRNNGTFYVGGNFVNTGSGNVSSDSGGHIQVDGDYDNTNGNTDVNGGTFVVGGSYSGNPATGDAGDCEGGGGGCCGSGCSTLPVTLTSCEVKNLKGSVLFKWETATEVNNHYFTLEWSLDGANYKLLDHVPGAGNSETTQVYQRSFPLPMTYGTTYYRLSQTDYDGTFEILKVLTTQLGFHGANFTIYPNPVGVNDNLTIRGAELGMRWSLYSVAGKLIREGLVETNEIRLPDTKPGTYLLKFQGEFDQFSEILLVK